MKPARCSRLSLETNPSIHFLHCLYSWETFSFGIWNPGLWNPEYSSRNLESNNRLESGIQVRLKKDSESSIWNPESTTRNPEFEAVLGSLTYMAGWLNAFVYKLKLTALVKIRFKGSFLSICRFYFLKRQKHIQFSVMLIEMSLFSWYLSISAWEAKSAK